MRQLILIRHEIGLPKDSDSSGPLPNTNACNTFRTFAREASSVRMQPACFFGIVASIRSIFNRSKVSQSRKAKELCRGIQQAADLLSHPSDFTLTKAPVISAKSDWQCVT